MKKTAGLIALSLGLTATGCALVPQTAVKSLNPALNASGPVTIHVDGIPTAERNTQSLASTAVMLEVKVYAADSVYGSTCVKAAGVSTDGTPTIQVNPANNAILVATASVAAGQATLTLPAMPAGGNIVVVNAYTSKNGSSVGWHNTTTGADSLGAYPYLIGQSEAYINALAGIPTAVSLPIYRVIPYGSMINTKVAGSQNPTASVTVSNISARTNGLTYIRMANYNPAQMASGRVRVSIVSTTAYSSALASNSLAQTQGGFWTAGWVNTLFGMTATRSLATSSLTAQNGLGASSWLWGDTARKVIYRDFDLAYDATNSATMTNLGSDSISVFFDPEINYAGAFSLAIPTAFLPTGYQLTITDLASGSTLAGAGSL